MDDESIYTSLQSPKTQLIFNKIYMVKTKLNSGSFGEVFLGKNLQNNTKCAIKLEEIKPDNSEINRSLLREASILRHLGAVPGVPTMLWFGSEHNYDVLVIELLGKDLASIVKSYKKFSLETILLIGLKVLSIIQSIHDKDVIHRDIKPDNILMGLEGKSEEFFLIDFGISKCYRDAKGRHLIFRENKPFIGTMRYASINSHMGVELSRRDDLESLGYVLLYLLKGYLPWQNVEANAKEKTYQVGKIKSKIKIEELCRETHKGFHEYFKYVKELDFNETPDYEYLKGLFVAMAKMNKVRITEIMLDWRINKDKMAEFLLGTSPCSSSLKIKAMRSGERFHNTELKEVSKEKHGTIISVPNSVHTSKPILNKTTSNNGTVSSLNNFYVPSKSYLKEDNFEESGKKNKNEAKENIRAEKKNGTILSLNNSLYSKSCGPQKSNNPSLINFYTPSKKDRYEECNFRDSSS